MFLFIDSYRLFVFPQKFICQNIISNVMVAYEGGAIGRCLGHEDKALMNRISALMKRSQKTPCSILPVRTQQKADYL